MSAPTTADLQTTVMNNSGATLFFEFLGRHGKTLAPSATYSFVGTMPCLPPVLTDQKLYQYQQSLLPQNGNPAILVVISSPRPIIADPSSAAIVANPTVAATATATGGGSSGGSLAAGNYGIAYTFVNAWGETTVGTSLLASLTVGATNIPRVTVPALPTGATSINIYVTAESGGTPSPATLRRYATGITTTTHDLAIALPTLGPSNPAPPTSNTTQAPESFGVDITNATLGIQDPSMGRVLV
jgi:hypothetical protein